MKKSERAAAIMQILTESPNKDFSLAYFAELFGCAKSSISDDIKVLRLSMDAVGLGYLETTSGAKGGVRYVPYISDDDAKSVLEEMRALLSESDRLLGSGFMYTSDIMFSPDLMKGAAKLFARHFASTDADVIVTVETKGIPVALMTAELLHLPLVVIRREARVSDGSTVSINFFSGSTERLQKMSLSKRALKPGSKAIIIDDFMRGGGSVKGIIDMLTEFDSTVSGVGVVISAGPKEKKIGDFYPLVYINEGENSYSVEINGHL